MRKFIFSLLTCLALVLPLQAQDVEAVCEETVEVACEQACSGCCQHADAISVAQEAACCAGAEAVAEGETGMMQSIVDFVKTMGFVRIFADEQGIARGEDWRTLVMLLISFFLLYLAIHKKYEPLLLLPIAFGMLLTNLPGSGMFHGDMWTLFLQETLEDGSANPAYHSYGEIMRHGGLLDILYIGVKAGVYPCLIFIGVGAMTDFGPLIANPKSLILGAAAQIGIFLTFLAANALSLTGIDAITFTEAEAGSIGIIGGADGPTSIFLTSKLAPQLLGPIAIAAYSYMALVPVIQPPIMRALTTKKERAIKMNQLRTVSKSEKIIFPVMVATIVALILPDAAPLIGCLMLGNLMKECGVVDRLSKTVQNELMNIVVIFLGLSVGATATAASFLNARTLMILAMGIIAFSMGTAGGVLLAKLMNVFSKEKINPLLGSAGVSAVPMAARVSQQVGQEENPSNFLLMHAMGPNVAGVIGSAVAAGILLTMLG